MTERRRPHPGGTAPLPSPEVRRLVERLKEAKEATGLSFAALAAATAYSKSSWERYLNGKVCPPRDAVETLARLSGADPARLLALWRLAEGAWSGRDARCPAAGPDTGTDAASGSEPRLGAVPTAGTGTKTGAGTEHAGTGHRSVGHEVTGHEGAGHEGVGASGGAAPAGVARKPERHALVVAVVATATVTAAVFGVAAWMWAPAADGPEPAAARTAMPCRGETCTDRDSEQGRTVCWTDATTHAVRTVRGRTVELRHSPMCDAVWGRIRNPRSEDRVWVETSDGRRQTRQVSVPSHSLYTLMVGVERPADARTCFDLGDDGSGCTRQEW
ncbi:helix-turn-helix domain-containing protein [Streptomyces sp. NPDC058751]|uniref:helix-turn-helix domain-containing protein n=1 Tax=Streptomyces sp. NPDC058751 TaxID=3346623 RepID=UPI0036AE66C1